MLLAMFFFFFLVLLWIRLPLFIPKWGNLHSHRLSKSPLLHCFLNILSTFWSIVFCRLKMHHLFFFNITWWPLLQLEIQRLLEKVNNQSLDVRTLESKTFPASAVCRSAHFYNVAYYLMLWKWIISHKSSADYDSPSFSYCRWAKKKEKKDGCKQWLGRLIHSVVTDGVPQVHIREKEWQEKRTYSRYYEASTWTCLQH